MATPATVRQGVDAVVALVAARLREQSKAYRDEEITAAVWFAHLLAEIKAAQIAASLAAHGGRENMTPSAWGMVGQVIRRQYGYARQFAADVLEGRQRLNGHMDNRAALYAAAATATYENTKRAVEAARGTRYERNELHAHESCRGCKSQSELGWVPLGTLSPIGSRDCRTNCGCTISYSDTRGA